MIHLALSIALALIIFAVVVFVFQVFVALCIEVEGFGFAVVGTIVVVAFFGWFYLTGGFDKAKVEAAVAHEEPLPPAYKVPNTYSYESNPNRDPITGEWILPENR
jgi:hypothetical protein